MLESALEKAQNNPHGTAARVLDAAEEIFAERGFAGASTRSIARRARVSLGAVHYHWRSKIELKHAVFSRIVDRLRSTAASSLLPGSSPEELLDNLTDAFLEILIASRNATRLLFREVLEPPDPRINELFAPLIQMGVQVLSGIGFTPEDLTARTFVVASAFFLSVANEKGQHLFLGESAFTSRQSRERLRRELRHLARRSFERLLNASPGRLPSPATYD